MNLVKLDEIENLNSTIKHGTFGSIYKVLYNGKFYAYKKYYNDIYADFFNLSIIEKLKGLTNIKLYSSLLPKYLVIDNSNHQITYLTKWSNDISLDTVIDDFDNSKKIEILKNIKKNILLLHKYGIIHGDIHCANILVNPKTNKSFIIDFDNCQYQNFKLDIDCVNIEAEKFIKKYGVTKELDIYMFNRMTYEILNKLSYTEINQHVIDNQDTFFYQNKDYYRICETMLLNSNVPANEFLIDNMQKIKRI